MEMCVVESPRSYAVRYPPRVRHQCTVKSPLLLPTLVLLSLYRLYYMIIIIIIIIITGIIIIIIIIIIIMDDITWTTQEQSLN